MAAYNTPNPASSFYAQAPDILLAILVFGESRNQPTDAQLATAWTVKNRVALNSREFGSGWWNVMLKPGAFDCFSPDDPNRVKLKTPLRYEPEAVWASCYAAASQVYNARVPDLSKGALFYFTPPLVEPPHAWGTVQLSAQFGNMKFYRRNYLPTVAALAA